MLVHNEDTDGMRTASGGVGREIREIARMAAATVRPVSAKVL